MHNATPHTATHTHNTHDSPWLCSCICLLRAGCEVVDRRWRTESSQELTVERIDFKVKLNLRFEQLDSAMNWMLAKWLYHKCLLEVVSPYLLDPGTFKILAAIEKQQSKRCSNWSRHPQHSLLCSSISLPEPCWLAAHLGTSQEAWWVGGLRLLWSTSELWLRLFAIDIPWFRHSVTFQRIFRYRF